MNDELNLKDLFTRLILFISRNFKLIFGIIFIGVISVIFYQKFKTPYYETKAICMSGISEYERVEYEESGWYDGQVWIKPLVLKEKESLIASIEVKPILKNLIQIFSIISVLALSGILLFQYNNF